MPVKNKQMTSLSSRASQSVPLLDDPPMGHLQAVILKKMEELGKDAFGFNVIEQLSLETGVWIDPAQVYATIRRLLHEKGYIEQTETRKSSEGGPPLKIYRLTAAGRAALKAVAAHHRAVADYLNDKRKAART